MIKRFKERNLHIVAISFLIGLFFGINAANHSEAEEPAHKFLDYFHQVYQIVKTNYVEIPNNKDIFYGAIKGIIGSLNDPYSRFLDEDAYASLKEETTGKFVGVGIEITIKDGEIIVISPIEDTPAMKAGINAEDVIIKIDDVAISGQNLSEIIKMIKGLPHTKVKLTIRRKGLDDPLDFILEREPIKIETVKYDIFEDFNNTGYLKIKLFSSDTPKDVGEAINFLNKKNIDKVIVDLRWNPGGLLDSAIRISDLFLEKELLIVSTKGREGAGHLNEFKSLNEPLFRGKLVVLVNKGSASASEIFSGAIKDNKRGKLIGEKTFGKGSVQKFFNLNDDIGITITTAKYYTPSGESIHGKGIVPDYLVEMEKIPEGDKENINKIYKEKLVENFVKDHEQYTDENKNKFFAFLKEKKIDISKESSNFILKKEVYRFARSPIYDLEFDNQLRKAIDVINGKEPAAKKG